MGSEEGEAEQVDVGVAQGSFEAELYHFLAQLCQLEHRSLTNLPRSTTHPATAFGSDGLL